MLMRSCTVSDTAAVRVMGEGWGGGGEGGEERGGGGGGGGGGEGWEERVERKVLGTRGEEGGGILLHEADSVEGVEVT